MSNKRAKRSALRVFWKAKTESGKKVEEVAESHVFMKTSATGTFRKKPVRCLALLWDPLVGSPDD